MIRTKNACRAGFSLLELSISFVIIAVIATAGLTLFASSLDRRQITETQGRLQAIQDALLTFRQTFDRLPCPADITLTLTNADFGVEASNPGSCEGGDIEANFDAAGTGGPVAGAIPTKTLRLPDDFAMDGYGRRILYAVDTRLTYTSQTASQYMPPFAVYKITNTTIGNITVEDAAGENRTTRAAYVLVSHGKNGHGAYGRAGGVTRVSKASTNSKELENCDCDSSGGDTGFNGVFVQAPLQDNATATSNSYDDMVVYELRANIAGKYE